MIEFNVYQHLETVPGHEGSFKNHKMPFWMIQSAKKEFFGRFLDLGLLDRLDIAYYDWTKRFPTFTTLLACYGSFKGSKRENVSFSLFPLFSLFSLFSLFTFLSFLSFLSFSFFYPFFIFLSFSFFLSVLSFLSFSFFLSDLFEVQDLIFKFQPWMPSIFRLSERGGSV